MATTENFKERTDLTANDQPKTFPKLLELMKPQLAAALPRHLTADRMSRIALTCFRQNPKLGECDPRSVIACVVQSAQLGLELGMRGHAFLVPYKRSWKEKDTWKSAMECQFIPGWIGLVDLVSRAGRATVWTGAVFEGDEFDYALGDMPFVKHRPGGEDDPKKLTHVYAIGRIKGGEYPVIEVWPISKVLKHLARYNKVGERHYANEHMEMYGRKVALLQVLKYIPSSTELNTAIALNDTAEVGAQGLTLKDAADGTWAPVEEVPQDEQHPPETAPEPKAKPEAKPQTVKEGAVAGAPRFAQLADRFNKCRDIEVLRIDRDLIEKVPTDQQNGLLDIWQENMSRLGSV